MTALPLVMQAAHSCAAKNLSGIYNFIMRGVHRFFIPDSIVFITSVTRNRIPFFTKKANRELFYSTIENSHEIHHFELLAQVLLPDHFHWLLKIENSDFSLTIKTVKGNFTRNFKGQNDITESLSLWQSRYWDHIIRNERDLVNHLDYIHWNPVKHGYVKDPMEWQSSSFTEWVDNGYYSEKWSISDLSSEVLSMNIE